MKRRTLALYAVAVLCFAIALIIVLGVIHSGNATAWQDGGFIATVLGLASQLVP